jgi:hypothetical protein
MNVPCTGTLKFATGDYQAIARIDNWQRLKIETLLFTRPGLELSISAILALLAILALP